MGDTHALTRSPGEGSARWVGEIEGGAAGGEGGGTDSKKTILWFTAPPQPDRGVVIIAVTLDAILLSPTGRNTFYWL